MDAHELDHALQVALHTAEEAGSILARGHRTAMTVQKKGEIDLVTEYDLASEAVVRERLGAVFPGHAIVGEEGAAQDLVKADREGFVWYVDPLDGTTNYAHGHPFFSVSIALYRGAEALVGVVHAPALHLTWHARRGGGAFRNGAPCRVSTEAALRETLAVTGFPYDRWTNPDNNTREFAAFLRKTQGIRRCGSAAIDLAMVGDGTYGLYWEQRLSPWDMAAGALVVLEGGGTLSDYDGSPADPRSGRLVATNGRVHDEALAHLRTLRREIEHEAR